MSLINFKQEIFGIDISDSSIKLAKLKKDGGNFSFESFGSFIVPPDLIVNGEIKKIAELAEFLKSIIYQAKGEKIKSKYVALSLPEEKTFIRVIERPKGDWKDIYEIIKLDAEKYIPVAINDVYIDCSLINDKYAILTAVMKPVADSYAQCLEMAGLEPMIFEPKAFSFARSIIPGNYTDDPVLILDLGSKKTNVSIFYLNSVCFSGILNLSANNLTQKIAQELAITFKEAELIKQQYGEQKTKYDKKIEKVADDFYLELISQTRNYINFFNEKPYAPKGGIKSVFITGGGSNFFGADKKIGDLLNIPVLIANPWTNILPKIPKKLPEITFKESQGYSIALGLAIRGANFDI